MAPATQPLVAVCLIVKDELEWIAAAIDSVRPYVAEINVYDTGSTDGTPELLEGMAAEPGAPIRVERGEWRRDFSWAREQSFAMASPETDWILWIDADDVVLGAENLRPYLAGLDEDTDCVRALFDDWRGPVFPIRVMRPRSGCFQCVLDEGWARHADSTAEPPIISSELFAVYHADRYAPPGKYIDLATEATADVERTPAAYFLLSRELWRAGRFEEAMHAVNVFLSENHDHLCTDTPWNWWRVKGYNMILTLWLALGDLERAEQAYAMREDYLEAWRSESDAGRAPDLRADEADAELQDRMWARYQGATGAASGCLPLPTA
jgi:glycosyltransferase involved in cell wall biosynthesis